MILKWFPLSIVPDILSGTDEEMLKLLRKGSFIKETNKRWSNCIVIESLVSGIFKIVPIRSSYF